MSTKKLQPTYSILGWLSTDALTYDEWGDLNEKYSEYNLSGLLPLFDEYLLAIWVKNTPESEKLETLDELKTSLASEKLDLEHLFSDLDLPFSRTESGHALVHPRPFLQLLFDYLMQYSPEHIRKKFE